LLAASSVKNGGTILMRITLCRLIGREIKIVPQFFTLQHVVGGINRTNHAKYTGHWSMVSPFAAPR
jgi:hypothetical protein